MDQSRWVLDRTMLRQSYNLLLEMGPKGISQQMMGQLMGKEEAGVPDFTSFVK